MSDQPDLQLFEANRDAIAALAYRMLGDTSSAQDIVQETWLRWSRRDVVVSNPRAYLLTIAARLCLNHLSAAPTRREEARAWLPEPVDVPVEPDLEIMEQVSMAFLVALQRLTAAERAVLLLHEVFDLQHAEIAELLNNTEAGCRQILKRARHSLTDQSRVAQATSDEHRRLLRAFYDAARHGDLAKLTSLLADDAVLITDGGVDRVRAGRVRTLVRPLRGANKIAALIAAGDASAWLDVRERVLNGQPALVAYRDGQPFAVVFLAVVDGRIAQVFMQADPRRLRALGSAS